MDRTHSILNDQFAPSKAIVKEQTEWLMENKYMKRDPGWNFHIFGLICTLYMTSCCASKSIKHLKGISLFIVFFS